MTRTLYLHIGSHRTATTSIQSFLHRNFDALVENGCLLPFRKPRHVGLINDIFDGNRKVPEVAKDLKKRADNKAPAAEISRIILSDEDVSMRHDVSRLGAFREHFDVKVVYSLRRQDLWLESWYFQNVKWQWNPSLSHCTFDEFLARREEFHWIHYDRYVRHLEDVFGAENILLNVFEKSQMPEGPVATFCRMTANEALIGAAPEPHVNSSMSATMVEFARHLPMDELAPPQRHSLRRSLEAVDRDVLGHTGKQSERLMPLDLRQAILAEYEAGNRALAARYFDREDLFLEPLPAPDMPLAQLTIPQDSAEMLAQFVAPLVRQMAMDGFFSTPKPTAKNK